jgi:hypothetical protein
LFEQPPCSQIVSQVEYNRSVAQGVPSLRAAASADAASNT